MNNLQSEQEKFWAGPFGDEYTQRNRGEAWVASNVAFFARILARTRAVRRVLEFGANIGLNLRAFRQLLPEAELSAVEINASAVEELRRWGGAHQIFHQSLLDFTSDTPWDLVVTKGVLIHLDPTALDRVYTVLHRSTRAYVCLAEYYHPRPIEVPYRNHRERLFKRDFAGEMLDRFPDLRLVDYGFCYQRDPQFPQDDLTWFLLEKAGH